MHRIVAIALLLSLSLHQGLFLLTSALVVDKAQTYASDDTMLICTGSDYKWISLSAFVEHGQTVYVEAPENAPTTNGHSLDCGYEYLSIQDSYINELPELAVKTLVYQQFAQRLAQRPYTAFPYLTSLSRAPPAIA